MPLVQAAYAASFILFSGVGSSISCAPASGICAEHFVIFHLYHLRVILDRSDIIFSCALAAI